MSLEQVEIKRSINNKLAQFFFAKSDGTAEALFRIGYAVVLFVDLLGQYGKLELLHSNQGLFVGTPIDGLYTPFLVKTIYFIWLATLLALVLGLWTRWCSLLNYGIIFYFFVLRGAFVGHGADWVYHSMGFYLMLMTSDRKFAVFKSRPEGWGNTQAMWPLRLAQINFLFIYFSAGVVKLFDPGWLDGSALELMFRHPLITYSTATWIASSKGILVLVTYLTILWQMSAPVALFSRRIRVFYVLTALFFHGMIAISMRVGWFSEIMVVSTLLFWNDLAFFGKRWRQIPAAESSIQVHRSGTPYFLIVFLSLFFLAQACFVFWPRGVSGHVAKIPGLFYYSAVTGNRPYDLVPSKYILENVRFVAFEAVDSNGKRMFLSPFDRQGRFAPPYRDVKEVRRGLMLLKIAPERTPRGWEIPLNPRGWKSLLQYDVMPLLSRQELSYPVRVNVFGINTPVGDVPRPFNINSVPKIPLFSATVQAPDGGLELNIPRRKPGNRGG